MCDDSNQWRESKAAAIDDVNRVLETFGMQPVPHCRFSEHYSGTVDAVAPFHSERCNAALRALGVDSQSVADHPDLRRLVARPRPPTWRLRDLAQTGTTVALAILALAGAATAAAAAYSKA